MRDSVPSASYYSAYIVYRPYDILRAKYEFALQTMNPYFARAIYGLRHGSSIYGLSSHGVRVHLNCASWPLIGR